MVLSASMPSTEQSGELRSCWIEPRYRHGQQGLIPKAGQLTHEYASPGLPEDCGCRGGVGESGLLLSGLCMVIWGLFSLSVSVCVCVCEGLHVCMQGH